jgi:hypothetical protein
MSRCLLAVLLLGIVSTAFSDPGQKGLVGADLASGGVIRAKLMGTWRLVSYEARQEDGTVSYPMGKDVQGFIMYTPDGYMAAQLMKPGRTVVTSDDVNKIAPNELATAAAGFFAYSGTFEVDETSKTVTHHVRISLIPNWVGGKQKRNVKFDGDHLTLSGGPITIDGHPQYVQVTWERPAPTPLALQ